jgi:hypothetical protein
VREIGIREHPEQAERDDVRDGIGDFTFVGFNRRRHRHNRGDAAMLVPAAINVRAAAASRASC